MCSFLENKPEYKNSMFIAPFIGSPMITHQISRTTQSAMYDLGDISKLLYGLRLYGR